MDVTDKESIHKAVKVLDEAEGKLDILVNNAGIVGPIFPFISNRSGSDPENATMGDSLFAKSTFEQWEEVFRTNTTAPFFVTMGFLSLLERGARSREGETSSVINISSNVSAVNISLSSFAYGISKAGVDRLTVTMATEFALSKIPVRVNAIAPGVFPSNLSGPAEEVAKWMTQPLPGAFNPNPLRRAGKEHEIGTTAVYLSSSAGEYTNGIVMRVDGGTHLVNP
ncbi:hypothetical protein VKT23_008451 [Stygiomarasmius scandens]|uniref:Short-chain dehydrogenase n=1 Tax=Marasmiellus scandens TaxID=2682957 RepID=A0ABR1JL52_9AGAR